MKKIITNTLTCPFMSNMVILNGIDETIEKLSIVNCICEKCMFWETTINGKKEIDKYKIPYDTYPTDAGNKHRQLIADGWEKVKDERETYIKYEESFEGYCKMIKKST